jgi:putative spermidine/putrescine transport system ATP-binding protein
VVAARPEHLAIGAPVGQALDAQVEMVLPIGPSLVYELRLSGGSTIKVTQPRTHDMPRFEIGQQVGVTLRPGSPAGVFVQ